MAINLYCDAIIKIAFGKAASLASIEKDNVKASRGWDIKRLADLLKKTPEYYADELKKIIDTLYNLFGRSKQLKNQLDAVYTIIRSEEARLLHMK